MIGHSNKLADRKTNRDYFLKFRDKSVPGIFPSSLFKFKKYIMSMKYRNKEDTPGTPCLWSQKKCSACSVTTVNKLSGPRSNVCLYSPQETASAVHLF